MGDSMGSFMSGWQGLVLVDLARPRSRIGLRLDATYGVNSSNPQPALHTRLMGGSADFIYVFQNSARAQPYLLTGLGLYNIRLYTTGGGTGVDTSSSKVSWNAGGGVRYGVPGATLFVEGRYRRVGRLTNTTAPDYRYIDRSVGPARLGITVGVRWGGLW
jgi:opacity protein-like surface antigen